MKMRLLGNSFWFWLCLCKYSVTNLHWWKLLDWNKNSYRAVWCLFITNQLEMCYYKRDKTRWPVVTSWSLGNIWYELWKLDLCHPCKSLIPFQQSWMKFLAMKHISTICIILLKIVLEQWTHMCGSYGLTSSAFNIRTEVIMG